MGDAWKRQQQLSGGQEERRWHWRLLVENAAASEIVVNVCLPWMFCTNLDGLWQSPSAIWQCFVVLILNLCGSFLEGVCKSTRLLSQTLRNTQTTHRFVFVTSRSFCNGFLNVLTSFPDIAGSGATVVLTTESGFLGISYCFAHMLGGVALHHWGRIVGWRFVQHRWDTTVEICRIWRLFVRALVLATCALMLFAESGGLPLDLSQPELVGCPVRIVYDKYVVSLPPMILGLIVGMFMSASGAAVALLFCDVLCLEQSRPTARFFSNFVATVLVVVVQQTTLPDDFAAATFVMVKFATSFCSALSAFSGTIGDVSDAFYGAADEVGMYKGGAKQWRLPAISGASNFFAHLVLTLMVMGFTVHWAPAPLENMEQQWVREVVAPAWGNPHSEG